MELRSSVPKLPSKGRALQPCQHSEPHHSTLAPLRFLDQFPWSPPLGFTSVQTGRTPQRPASQPQVDPSLHDTLGDPAATTQGDGLAFLLQGDAMGGGTERLLKLQGRGVFSPWSCPRPLSQSPPPSQDLNPNRRRQRSEDGPTWATQLTSASTFRSSAACRSSSRRKAVARLLTWYVTLARDCVLIAIVSSSAFRLSLAWRGKHSRWDEPTPRPPSSRWGHTVAKMLPSAFRMHQTSSGSAGGTRGHPSGARLCRH